MRCESQGGMGPRFFADTLGTHPTVEQLTSDEIAGMQERTIETAAQFRGLEDIGTEK